MELQKEYQVLQQYALLTNSKILATQEDLAASDQAMFEMLDWCKQFGDSIVVLYNGAILSSTPTARLIQNCKITMKQRGLGPPGPIRAATSNLISIVLQKANENLVANTASLTNQLSMQQQRLHLLIREALKIGATDIHFQVRSHLATIYFRVLGELVLHCQWLPQAARAVLAVAFNRETDYASSHFNPTVPQNGSMSLTIGQESVRLRLSGLPAYDGFDVVMRLLKTTNDPNLSLSTLGYTTGQIHIIKKAINMPSGAVIIAGPTGSGKTTTLAACMNVITSNRKIYTIEDPVEQIVLHATQIPVNTEHYDESFARMARSVLRMDPDIIVLGEMRDEDTAKIMVRSAITGHLVFSTIHTNSAPEIVTRLVDLGVSSTALANANLLTCLICQRLAPVLCEQCAIFVTNSAKHKPHLYRLRAVFGNSIEALRARGNSQCKHCQGLGIAGRTVVAEIIWIDNPGREFIQQGNMLGWRTYLKNNGWETYHDHLMHLVRRGICDPLDAEKMIGEMNLSSNNQQYQYNTTYSIKK